MQNELEEWKDRARRILSLAQEVVDHCEKTGIEFDRERIIEEGMYKLIASAFLFSAVDDFKAIYLLLTNGLVSQAIMIVRHLFELMVNLRFISKCPNERVKQYSRFDPIERAKWLKKLEDYGQSWVAQQDQVHWQIWIEESMEDLGLERLPRGWEWSGSSIEKMAEKTGLSNQYLGVYKICCSFTHPSPWGLSHCFRGTPNGGLEYVQPHQFLPIFWIAIGYFFDIIRKANQILEIGFDEVLEEVFANYQNSIEERSNAPR